MISAWWLAAVVPIAAAAGFACALSIADRLFFLYLVLALCRRR